ncbi:MAG: ABC transporter permease [Actinomycetaceae bacterium]|nr:ABC transporter permease [Actinomycetaceae bacterium]
MSADTAQFTRPGRSKGLLETFSQRYLVSLLVHKELRIRYRGSVLGMVWSYVKPAFQFLVFYFAIGVFMKMRGNIDNYVIYMFAGVVVVNYFNEIFNNGTRCVVWNADLVNKIYLPRELFPVASTWVAFIHFIPQVVILAAGAMIFGWQPGFWEIAVLLYAFVVITTFALGVGLLSGAINVFYRDAENFVELVLMAATWASPVLYSWEMVHNVLGDGPLWWLYQLNPITAVVEMFHIVFWMPTAGVDAQLPPQMGMWALASGITAILTVVVGELVFRKLDPKFAQEL